MRAAPASGDGERLTFDFILNSYTRWPREPRGEQIARRNKSIFPLGPRELNKDILINYARRTAPRLLFNAGLTRAGSRAPTVCGRSEGICRVIFLICAFCLVTLPFDDPVVGRIPARPAVDPSTTAADNRLRENRNRPVSSLAR